jgi:hypothetical protein
MTKQVATRLSQGAAGHALVGGLGPVIVCLSVAALAISNQSYWIDESYNAWKAGLPTLAEWWQDMASRKGSDLQMPFYMFYTWAWDKVFGHTEWWLRAANLPWLAVGLLAIPRRQLAFLLAVALSPFVWYCLDEARPYAMQLGATLLMVGALWHLAETPADGETGVAGGRGWVCCFCVGLLVLAGSSLLGVIWDAAALGAALAVLGWRQVLLLGRRNLAAVVITLLVLSALAPYYLWTLKQGARAAQIRGGLGNAVFAGYEVAGLSGLGPGRLEIRSAGGPGVFVKHAIPLGAHAILTTTVFLAGCWYAIQRAPRRLWLGVAVAVGGVACLLLTAGFVTHFRVLGRHFAPMAICVLLLLATGLRALWAKGVAGRLAALAFLLLCAASAMSLRWAPRHAKDDYREAAAIAQTEVSAGQHVWWCADEIGGRFYGLALPPRLNLDEPGKATLLLNPSAAELFGNPSPDLIVLSKVDIYDNTGAVRDYLKQRGYRQTQALPAFTFWRN